MKKAPFPIVPPSVLGVLGGGQLGQMFAMAAKRMGYGVAVFCPEANSPAGKIADKVFQADYLDLDRVKDFAETVSVVTVEFENIPSETLEHCDRFTHVAPKASALHTTQHRVREKEFLKNNGIPVTRFITSKSETPLAKVGDELGYPFIVKSAGFGYDGKGQKRIASEKDTVSFSEKDWIAEALVDFEREISVVCARNATGAYVDWSPIENAHVHHILDLSTTPANISAPIARKARELARAVAEALDYVGVMCVEFFVTRSGEVLVNEIAPRPHNSGHLTIEAARTSQFEQQARAICGVALGDTTMPHPAAMANLLGDLWSRGEPDWERAKVDKSVKFHLYGKIEAKPGRKMGHITALDESVEGAAQKVLQARRRLTELK